MTFWITAHAKQLITTAGLLADILGAILVAFEIFKKYDGAAFNVGEQKIGGPSVNSEEYQLWEQDKFRTMTRGLIYLTIGFLLQIFAAWL